MASFQNAQGQFVGYNQSPQHFVGQPSVPSLSPQVGYQHASGGLATGQVPNLPMSGNLNPGMVPNLPISTNLNPGPTVNQPADPTISANAYSNGPQQVRKTMSFLVCFIIVVSYSHFAPSALFHEMFMASWFVDGI